MSEPVIPAAVVPAAEAVAEVLDPVIDELIPLKRRQQLKHWLLGAKKALSTAAGFGSSSLAVALVGNAHATEFVGGIGIATTVIVYVADNLT